MNTHCVYHLHHNTGTDDGYIGVTKNLRRRLYQHRANGLFGEGVKIRILKVGPESECLRLERLLRPNPGMGWNKAEGGWNKCVGSIGKETRIRKGERRSPVTEFKKGQEAHNAGSTLYLLTDPSGHTYRVDNLTTFCKDNNLTRENIRKVARGTRKHHKGWSAVIIGRC